MCKHKEKKIVKCSKCGDWKIVDQNVKENSVIDGWVFWCKFNINSVYTDKYCYLMEKDYDQKWKFVKIKNSRYNPLVKPLVFEDWECENCYEKSLRCD
jgi:hypothetical protein